MKKDPDNPQLSLSADLLVPGVGEIIGGSTREDNYKMLVERMNEEGLNTGEGTPYYWYLDLRKYGSVPHSGFGLGLERTVTWIAGLEHIRDSCLYPRVTNRITP